LRGWLKYGALVVELALWVPMPSSAADLTIEAAILAEKPTIDGVLDEEVWATAAVAEGFAQFVPEFGEASPFRTVVLVGYTAEALYVAFRCFDSDPDRLASAITSRDGELDRDDTVAVLLDTYHNRRTAYYFATNLLGVQADGKVADNGRTVDEKWDAAWESASTRSVEGWTAEFSMPLQMLRFASGDDVSWGINFFRFVPRRLETSVWSGPGESEWRVSSFGTLSGLDVRPQELKRFALIPYGLVAAESGGEVETKVGGDIRLRISSELSADATINPDFALIEADVEEINLTRFELFVPEKRPFFLEGLEMFDQRLRQVYTRRIGDISWGGKLVGKLAGFDLATLVSRAELHPDEDLDVTTDSVDADYGVLRAQRGVFGPSTIGFLAASRSVAGDNVGSVGADMTLFFTEKIGMTGQFLRSHGPTNDGTIGWFLRPAYDTANSHFHVRYTHLDAGLLDNVNAVGFLRDDDRKEFDSNVSHTLWFTDKAVEKLEGKVNYNRYLSQEGVLRSWEVEADVEIVFTSGWQIELSYDDGFELFEKEFRNSLTSVEVGYDNRTGKSVFLEVGSGKNFDSDLALATLVAKLNLSSAWNVSYEATWLSLDPDPEQESTWIHVLRTNYYFTNNLFVSLFAQTNSVIEKENVQALAVWRFRPPFGSLQVAYQRGTSEIGTASDQGDTLFTKFSWVF